MAVYMIFIREGSVRNREELDIYSRMNREAPRHLTMKPLVVYGAIEALEGEAPDGIVMLQFPTVEDARAWYGSPEYQAAIPHRRNAAHYRAMIVSGL